MIRISSLAILVAIVFGAVPASAAETIYVVRHLQKAAGDNPPLTPEGTAGAQRIADILAAKGVTAVFATPTRRAEETATPLAKRLGINVTLYDPKSPDALVKTLASVKGAALIVGHSNTVPDLVAAFGGAKPAEISEQDYGTIFVVSSGASVVREVKVMPAVDASRPAN
jgi:broad specificity phosphatase PhoE